MRDRLGMAEFTRASVGGAHPDALVQEFCGVLMIAQVCVESFEERCQLGSPIGLG